MQQDESSDDKPDDGGKTSSREHVVGRIFTPVARCLGFRPFRAWRILAGVAGLLLVSPFALHRAMIAGLPDIPEPFDVEQFAHLDIAPADNAFELYRMATEKQVPLTKALEAIRAQALEQGWEAVTPELLEWLDANREALDLFLRGSEKDQALCNQPNEAGLPDDASTSALQGLVAFARIVTIESLRLEHVGDVAGAWRLYRAVMRASRHAGMHASGIHRAVGNAIHAALGPSILRWAALPQTGARELRAALAELPSIYDMTEPPSTMFKVQYYVALRLFNDPNSLQDPNAAQMFSNQTGYLLLYPLGEPEMSRRVCKLICVNWLRGCDRPLCPRDWLIDDPSLFKPDPAGAPAAGGLSPQQIVEWFQRTKLSKGVFLPAMFPGWLRMHHRELARQRLLETALAAQLYRVEHGHYPQALDDLLTNGILTAPIDPFGEGEMIRYRRLEDGDGVKLGARIWSIGADSVDDDGLKSISDNDSGLGDIVMQIVPRAESANAEKN